MPKSTRSEIEQRINAVYLLLLRRAPRAQILQYAAAKWGVSDRTSDDYIARARDRMVRECAIDREIARAEHVAIRRDLYHKAYEDGKWGAAFQIAQDEAKLGGLYYTLKDHLQAVIAAGYVVTEPEDDNPATAEAEAEN